MAGAFVDKPSWFPNGIKTAFVELETEFEAARKTVSVLEHGADPSGQFSSKDAFERASDEAGIFGKVEIPAGKFELGTGVQVQAINQHWEGAARLSTWLHHTPTADGQSAVKAVHTQDAFMVEKFRISSDVNTFNITALDVEDMSTFFAQHIQVGQGGAGGGYGGDGTDSVAFYVKGREVSGLTNCDFWAPVPIRLGVNPNDITLDVDQFNFHNMYLVSTDDTDTLQRACVLFDDQVNVYQTSFTGFQAWITKSNGYGLYKVDSGATSNRSENLLIEMVRTESSVGTIGTNWSIYIDQSLGLPLRNLVLRTSTFDEAHEGIFLRNVDNVVHENINLSQGVGRIVADYGDVQALIWDGVWTQPSAGTLNLGTLVAAQAFTKTGDTHPHTAVWDI